jgi:hypothetical protein
MKASDLIRILNRTILASGDLEVVVCGLDGYGFTKLGEVSLAMGVHTPDSAVCEYCPAEDAKSYGKDPNAHEHFIYLG